MNITYIKNISGGTLQLGDVSIPNGNRVEVTKEMFSTTKKALIRNYTDSNIEFYDDVNRVISDTTETKKADLYNAITQKTNDIISNVQSSEDLTLTDLADVEEDGVLTESPWEPMVVNKAVYADPTVPTFDLPQGNATISQITSGIYEGVKTLILPKNDQTLSAMSTITSGYKLDVNLDGVDYVWTITLDVIERAYDIVFYFIWDVDDSVIPTHSNDNTAILQIEPPVIVTHPPVDGDVLTYDALRNRHVPKALPPQLVDLKAQTMNVQSAVDNLLNLIENNQTMLGLDSEKHLSPTPSSKYVASKSVTFLTWSDGTTDRISFRIPESGLDLEWWNSLSVGDPLRIFTNGTIYDTIVQSRETFGINTKRIYIWAPSGTTINDFDASLFVLEPDFDDPENTISLAENDILSVQDGRFKPLNYVDAVNGVVAPLLLDLKSKIDEISIDDISGIQRNTSGLLPGIDTNGPTGITTVIGSIAFNFNRTDQLDAWAATTIDDQIITTYINGLVNTWRLTRWRFPASWAITLYLKRLTGPVISNADMLNAQFILEPDFENPDDFKPFAKGDVLVAQEDTVFRPTNLTSEIRQLIESTPNYNLFNTAPNLNTLTPTGVSVNDVNVGTNSGVNGTVSILETDELNDWLDIKETGSRVTTCTNGLINTWTLGNVSTSGGLKVLTLTLLTGESIDFTDLVNQEFVLEPDFSNPDNITPTIEGDLLLTGIDGIMRPANLPNIINEMVDSSLSDTSIWDLSTTKKQYNQPSATLLPPLMGGDLSDLSNGNYYTSQLSFPSGDIILHIGESVGLAWWETLTVGDTINYWTDQDNAMGTLTVAELNHTEGSRVSVTLQPPVDMPLADLIVLDPDLDNLSFLSGSLNDVFAVSNNGKFELKSISDLVQPIINQSIESSKKFTFNLYNPATCAGFIGYTYLTPLNDANEEQNATAIPTGTGGGLCMPLPWMTNGKINEIHLTAYSASTGHAEALNVSIAIGIYELSQTTWTKIATTSLWVSNQESVGVAYETETSGTDVLASAAGLSIDIKDNTRYGLTFEPIDLDKTKVNTLRDFQILLIGSKD